MIDGWKIDDAAQQLAMRPASEVMDLERLGKLHPYRLSFMRSLIRKMGSEKWQITQADRDWDDDGHGHVIYEIRTSSALYSFVAFSKYIDPDVRNDRVIATEWDMTATLCEGAVDAERLEQLRANVPLQENGRLDAKCLVLSRANKSLRNFPYVLECLEKGEQPSVDAVANIGYLYRTTAVYGSGKFGLADWRKVQSHYRDFGRPFMAEMLVCYLIRKFSLDQVEHIANRQSGAKAAKINPALKRYIGIGNATGLGMAPFLINHPLLINRWVEAREIALARVLTHAEFNASYFEKFMTILRQAIVHLGEVETENGDQNAVNKHTRAQLRRLRKLLDGPEQSISSWQELWTLTGDKVGVEAREMTGSIMIELFPDLVDDLEDHLCEYEEYPLDAAMPIDELKSIIATRYDWAMSYDFNSGHARAIFWYRSAEKMEPRLGARGQEPGENRELMIGVAHAVQQCSAALDQFGGNEEGSLVAEFILAHPEHRRIVRRIQTMAQTKYGEIRANLLDAEVFPIHLLRCKLSFFGVGRFDPRSRLWVRNTMYQGAPLPEDLGKDGCDDWYFPVKPQVG